MSKQHENFVVAIHAALDGVLERAAATGLLGCFTSFGLLEDEETGLKVKIGVTLSLGDQGTGDHAKAMKRHSEALKEGSTDVTVRERGDPNKWGG